MKIQRGTLLYTRDGRKIGNAIVLQVEDDGIKIKTSFGNVRTLTEGELVASFHISTEVHSIDLWIQKKRVLLSRGVENEEN